MFRTVLQLSRFSTVDVVLLASDFLTAVIGIIIGYIAYRAYRNTEEQPMLFVAAGFILVFLIPTVLAVVGLFGPLMNLTAIAVLTQVSELCGMVSILYGLRVPASR